MACRHGAKVEATWKGLATKRRQLGLPSPRHEDGAIWTRRDARGFADCSPSPHYVKATREQMNALSRRSEYAQIIGGPGWPGRRGGKRGGGKRGGGKRGGGKRGGGKRGGRGRGGDRGRALKGPRAPADS